MYPKILLLTIVLLFPTLAAAQPTPELPVPPVVAGGSPAEKLRKDAVVFLRETLTDVNTMRSAENRISFTAELAALMWFHDEREARAMYVDVITDFKDLIARYDAQMNELAPPSGEEEEAHGGPMRFLVFDPTDRMRLLRKFTMAMGVRQQIVLSMAEHDPDLAFAFHSDSLSLISNPELRKGADGRDGHFEGQLLAKLAEKNAEKALKYAVKSVEKGFNYQHLDILRKLYEKDPDKGAEFAGAILGKLKKEKLGELYLVSALIDFGGEKLEESRKPGGKRPVYTLAELRELAELLAQAILNQNPEGLPPSFGLAHVSAVEKFQPGRAAQIRAKFKMSGTASNVNSNAMADYDAVEDAGYAANVMSSNSNSTDPAALRRQAREKAEEQMLDDIKGLESRQLAKEERNKVIAQARKIISQTPGRDKKVMALSLLAAQVMKMGDKELASEIMRDAELLVNPSPKNYQDYLLSWMLASGYAQADPDKAFPLLEDTIGRANDTLGAFIKVAEFVDANEDFIHDGELQVGAFGGQMVRGLTSELGMADATIQVLAKADFQKTKDLTNRFDRGEIRVLAKMMVLRAVLDTKRKPEGADDVPQGMELK